MSKIIFYEPKGKVISRTPKVVEYTVDVPHTVLNECSIIKLIIGQTCYEIPSPIIVTDKVGREIRAKVVFEVREILS